MSAATWLLVLAVFGMVQAAEAQQFGDYYIDNNGNGTCSINQYTGAGGAVTIPNTLNGLPVTSIGDFAFYNCTNLTSVAMPGSVTSIGGDAFDSCTNLTSVTIPDSVTSIGGGAFYDCIRLISIYFQGNAPVIGSDVFDNDGFLDVYYQPNTTGWSSSFGGVTTFSVFNWTTNNGAITITEYNGPGGAVAIPDSINGLPVTDIGDQAFNFSMVTSVTIPDSVTNIGNAFYDCYSLTSITIGNGVTSIGDSVFDNCQSLTSIYFLGNAPTLTGNLDFSPNLTVYYLPGTTGWGATFGGDIPAVLWNPKATAFNKADGYFGFNITGPANVTIVVEACANLSNAVWLPVSTNTLSSSGASAFSDPQSANYSSRFYRFRSP